MVGPLVHHVEICVSDDENIIKLLTEGFHFKNIGNRKTTLCRQTILQSGSSIFLVTKRFSEKDHFGKSVNNQFNTTDTVIPCSDNALNSSAVENKTKPEQNSSLLIARNDNEVSTTFQANKSDASSSCINSVAKMHDDLIGEHIQTTEHWTVFCCDDKDKHTVDSVFNVALEVKNVDQITERVQSKGGCVIRPPCEITDTNGSVRYSIVRSCCGNIIHTLISKSNYLGTFLPGFEIDSDYILNPTPNEPLTTHMDHVTYVCRPGESTELICWYEQCFGMKRFMANSTESITDGFVLADNIGLRLKALEYWRCAETGITSSDNQSNNDQSLKLVIAEPLPDVEISHVAAFLKAHHCPGIQHIGLHSNNILETVALMSDHVPFRKPPSTYYNECGKLKNIEELGYKEFLDKFQQLGVLLDIEPDSFTELSISSNSRHLMQIFTTPIFSENTFFMEIIQRCGAEGFGSGNIAALAKSILLQQELSV